MGGVKSWGVKNKKNKLQLESGQHYNSILIWFNVVAVI
jgi:hypothetical protein